MALRNYSDYVFPTTLTAGISTSDTSMVVASATGLPSAPFTMLLDWGTASQEVVLVTAVSGTTLTISRAFDGKTPFTHSAGAIAVHGVCQIDFSDANTHVNSSSGVHGVTGSVVGTGGTQTLTGKTLTSPIIDTSLPFLNAVNCPSANVGALSSSATTTSTTYTSSLSTGTPVSLSFTPGTANIFVSYGSWMSNGTAAERCWLSFRITRNSDSAIMITEGDTRGLASSAPSTGGQAIRGIYPVFGTLTAGVAYTVTLYFRVSAGTGTYNTADLAVSHAI